jgi:transposase
VARIFKELGIHVITIYKWGKTWRLQGVVPASEKHPEGWGATDKVTVVLETAGLNATELSAYCRWGCLNLPEACGIYKKKVYYGLQT